MCVSSGVMHCIPIFHSLLLRRQRQRLLLLLLLLLLLHAEVKVWLGRRRVCVLILSRFPHRFPPTSSRSITRSPGATLQSSSYSTVLGLICAAVLHDPSTGMLVPASIPENS